MIDVNNLLWVEKYRPKTLSDCILPTDLVTVFNGMIKEQSIPNMMFYGKAGTGKTTVAREILRVLGVPESVPVLSPTFTYMTEYETPSGLIAHMDL